MKTLRIALAVLFVLSLTANLARSQPAAAKPDDDDDEPKVQQQNGFQVAAENFDAWIYGQVGGAQKFRERLATQLKLQLDDISRYCNLTEAQRKKLLLAGAGDIKRFDDRVAVVREHFEAVRFDQNKFNSIWQEIQPLQMTAQGGLFESDSIFQKSVPQTLEADQRKKYEEAVRQRSMDRYRTLVELSLANIESGVPMTDKQRATIIDMLLTKSRPPRSYNQYAHYFVMNRLSKIPEGDLRPLFDERQWKAFSIYLQQGRGMEQFLRQNGVLESETDAANPPATAAGQAAPAKQN